MNCPSLRPPDHAPQDMDFPGLLVSRSIGDHAAATIGCTSEPEITQHTLGDGDRFLVIGSDGIWDVVENEEAMTVLTDSAGKPPSELAYDLVQRALQEWEDRHLADNITVMVVEMT